MEGKIVFKGQSDKGKGIVIRYPKKDDILSLLDYINTLSKERTYIVFQGEEVSPEEETKYLDSQLEKIADNKAVMLLVFYEGRLIGNSGVELKDKIEKHIGVFGITIAEGFRGEGIGSKLMELVLKEAENNLPDLEIVTLSVFSNNDLAKQIYRKFGFVKYGSLPKGVKLESSYTDHEYMYKILSC